MKVRDFLNVCCVTTKISLFDYDSMTRTETKKLCEGFVLDGSFTEYLDREIEWISTHLGYPDDSDIQIFI